MIWPDNIRIELIHYFGAPSEVERCGLVLMLAGGLTFVPCDNVASNPAQDFIVDPEMVNEYLEYILCVVHSHTNGNPEMSAIDLKTANKRFLCGIWTQETFAVYGFDELSGWGRAELEWSPST